MACREYHMSELHRFTTSLLHKRSTQLHAALPVRCPLLPAKHANSEYKPLHNPHIPTQHGRASRPSFSSLVSAYQCYLAHDIEGRHGSSDIQSLMLFLAVVTLPWPSSSSSSSRPGMGC